VASFTTSRRQRSNLEEFSMIRFTRIAVTHSTQTIKLEGKLIGPWVDEVRKASASGTVPSRRISLDLSALAFVDAAGERLLCDLIGRGMEVVACSSYVAELLRSKAEVSVRNAAVVVGNGGT
jgi:anti-anti-sigma regulatory factor